MWHRRHCTQSVRLLTLGLVLAVSFGTATPAAAQSQETDARDTPVVAPQPKSSHHRKPSPAEIAEQRKSAELAAEAAMALRRVQGPIPAKVMRYSKRLMKQYDVDQSGRLEADELQNVAPTWHAADANRDNVVTFEELIRHIADYGRRRRIRLVSPGPAELSTEISPGELGPRMVPGNVAGDSQRAANGTAAGDRPVKSGPRRGLKFFVPTSRLPQGLPEWYLTRDADGDGQLTLREFAPKASGPELNRFTLMDADRDGLVTASEYLRSTRASAAAAEKAAEAAAADRTLPGADRTGGPSAN